MRQRRQRVLRRASTRVQVRVSKLSVPGGLVPGAPVSVAVGGQAPGASDADGSACSRGWALVCWALAQLVMTGPDTIKRASSTASASPGSSCPTAVDWHYLFIYVNVTFGDT